MRVAGGDLCRRQKHRPSRQARPRHYHHLRKANRILFSQLTISGKMNNYLADIDRQAEEMYSQLVKQLAEKESITETLKATDQMEWVRRMNSVCNRAAEIVNKEMIFV